MSENNKLGQDPVHPTPHYNEESGHMNGFSDGMSKRFYAACAAMQGMLANSNSQGGIIDIIKTSYEFADELLKQENE